MLLPYDMGDLYSNLKAISNTGKIKYCPASILSIYSYKKDLLESYNEIFAATDNDIKENRLKFVCSSADIKEETEHGDYDYYMTYMWFSGAVILYMKPSHKDAYPHKLMLYGQSLMITISDDKENIKVTPMGNNLIDKITHNIEKDILIVREYLRCTDRESLINDSEWK